METTDQAAAHTNFFKRDMQKEILDNLDKLSKKELVQRSKKQLKEDKALSKRTNTMKMEER